MRNIRLFIKGKNLDMLKAFSDESYLYNYIVNNYSELPEDNIFRNPTFLKRLEEMVYLSKDNISLVFISRITYFPFFVYLIPVNSPVFLL